MRIRTAIALVLAFFTLAGCGRSSSGSSVTGVVYAPNGVDPVAGADVYVPSSGDGSLGAPENAAIRTRTGPDGRFTLEGVPEGETTVVIASGIFRKTCSANVSADAATVLHGSQTTLPAVTGDDNTARAPRFAVVTGDYDGMSDVLAKFGMGQVDDNGALVPGSERFDPYVSHAGGIPTTYVKWNAALGWWDYLPFPESYPAASTLFDNLARMRQYDVIVVNCGVTDNALVQDPAVVANIHDFVQQGGRLYVTDWSYNYIEQVFPNYIRFQNWGDANPSTPETIDAAQAGLPDITSDADVRDTDLSAWLAGLGVLNPDGTVHIEDFLYRWVVMVGPHTGTIGSQCKVWVEGPVSWYVATSDDSATDGGVRPLTVSFHYGTGKVIYTSYHTDSYPHPGFTPQERILEYLLFESVK